MNHSTGPRVLVTDVTLREFGQNVPKAFLKTFTPAVRIQTATDLILAGVRRLEVLSCVHPKIAPAMAREALKEVASGIGRVEGVEISTLVPNRAGYRIFTDLGLGPDGYGHVMGMFVSAVEAHNRANLGRSIQATLEEYEGVARDAASCGIAMDGYVSAAFGFREHAAGLWMAATPEEVSRIMDRLFQMGVRTVTLSDLQGVADEEATVRFLKRLLEQRQGEDLDRMAYHPHHASGERAVDNSLAVLAFGIRRFDASIGGTGGCVTGAPGNQPTELLVRRLHAAGAVTGIDEERLERLGSDLQYSLWTALQEPTQPPPARP